MVDQETRDKHNLYQFKCKDEQCICGESLCERNEWCVNGSETQFCHAIGYPHKKKNEVCDKQIGCICFFEYETGNFKTNLITFKTICSDNTSEIEKEKLNRKKQLDELLKEAQKQTEKFAKQKIENSKQVIDDFLEQMSAFPPIELVAEAILQWDHIC